MKRLLLVIALVASTSAAVAAPPPVWASLSARETRVAGRIDRAEREHRITRAEADRLHRQLHRIQSLSAYYRKTHGMTAWERRDVERRLKALDARIGKRRTVRPKA